MREAVGNHTLGMGGLPTLGRLELDQHRVVGLGTRAGALQILEQVRDAAGLRGRRRGCRRCGARGGRTRSSAVGTPDHRHRKQPAGRHRRQPAGHHRHPAGHPHALHAAPRAPARRLVVTLGVDGIHSLTEGSVSPAGAVIAS